MKKIFFLMLASVGLALQAQDPGTVVSVFITNNNQVLKGDELMSYQVTMPGMFSYNPDYEGGEFMFHNWDPYQYQMYTVNIVHNKDSMQISFEIKNGRTFDKYLLWNARFILKVPFYAGCFKVTEFEMEKDRFILSSSIKWRDRRCKD